MPLGVQGDILCDRRTEVKAVRICRIGIPALQRVAFRVRDNRRADGAAVRDIRLYGMRFATDHYLILKRSGEHRCNPLCVDHDVARRHRSICKIKCCGACLILVPTGEHETFVNAFRAVRRISAVTRKALLIFRGSGVYNARYIIVLNIVAFTRVVQMAFVVFVKVLLTPVKARSACTLAYKAFNGVILFLISHVVEVGINRLKQSIPNTTLYFIRCDTGQALYPVIDGLERIGALIIQPERYIRTRHTVECLQGIAIGIARIFPCTAVICCVEGCLVEFIRNIRTILSGNGGHHAGSIAGAGMRVFFKAAGKPALIATLVMPMPEAVVLTHEHPLIATPAMCMLLLSAGRPVAVAGHKRKRIFLAVIVHIQNRAAVARNQLIIAVFAHYKMRIVLFIKRGFGTCVPLLRRGFHIAVAIVVRIFLPVHHGVVHKLRLPLCGKREVAGNGRVEVKRGFTVQPACKRIPRKRWCCGFGNRCAVLHIEDGTHIAAAVGFKRNGIGVAGIIHRDHRALRRNHGARHGVGRGAAFIGLCNRGHSRARLRVADRLFILHDEAAVDLLNPVLHRIARIRYGIGDGNSNAAGRHCAGNGFLARFYHVSLNFRGIYAVWCANGKHRFIRSAQLIAVGVLIMNGKRGRRGCELRRYLRIRNNGSVALIPADKNLFVCGFIVRDCRVRFCRNCGIRVFGDRHREFALSYHERNGVFRCRLLCRLRRWVTCRIASLQNVGHRRSIRLFAFGHVDDRITLSKRKFTVAEERAAKHDKRQQHCKRFFELVHTLFSFPSSSISSVSAHTARRPAVPVFC